MRKESKESNGTSAWARWAIGITVTLVFTVNGFTVSWVTAKVKDMAAKEIVILLRDDIKDLTKEVYKLNESVAILRTQMEERNGRK